MFIKNIEIKNFRLLREVSLTLQKDTTVIVGRNNSGKTSLTEIFRRFFPGESKNTILKLEDFSLASMHKFNEAFQAKLDGKNESEIRNLLPSIDLILTVDYFDNKKNYGALSEFVIDLDENATETKIKVSYQLKKQAKVDFLFDGLNSENKGDLYSVLKEQIPRLYSPVVFAIDPTDLNNNALIDPSSKLFNCIGIDFINAQRGLDDVTQSEKDLLGKVLGNIFKSASSPTAPNEMKKKSKEIEDSVKKLQIQVDADLKGKVSGLLPVLSVFGYPGLSDPQINTETNLDVKTIIDTYTKIKYQQENGISFPETYNGLGSRNLIYILFKLFEFFRAFQSNPIEIQNHLIFIEEPEAHLHPQMQEVFIRKLNEIADQFSKTMNGGKRWPVQFVVSTHSTHIANEANFDSIRYFFTKETPRLETFIKDLNAEFNTEENKEDKEFIHKYLTLTKCDLYFADKAMLIEGPTERILMPSFIKKIDQQLENRKLSSQYVSVVEIGGAYAHHFYKFLDFLELKTLIITDLDSTKLQDSKYPATPVNTGTHSSNVGLTEWFKKTEDKVLLSEIKSKKEGDKIEGYRRIAFQIPEKGKTACGRSFEDAFMLANKTMFNLRKDDGTELENEAFEKAGEKEKKKANFAIELALSDEMWKTPYYIEEGLLWLANENHKEVEIMEVPTND